MHFRLGLLNKDWAESFTPTLLIFIYNMGQTFKQNLGQSVGCMVSERIHKRKLTWNILKSAYGKCYVIIDFEEVFIE